MHSRWVALAFALFAAAAGNPKSEVPTHRLDESRLDAVQRARLEWSKVRVVRPQIGIYRDFRAILHVHAAPDPEQAREQILKAAKDNGVDMVLWTGAEAAPPDWLGVRHGVLFMAASEDGESLRYPGGPAFLTGIEPPAEGFAGMEIYNRHSDAKTHPAMSEYLDQAAKHSGEWRKFSSRANRYPDAVYAAGTDSLPEFLARYDREIAQRQFTAIAGSDAFRNQSINGAALDSYDVAFRFVSTHILARELNQDQIRDSLRDGHAYVAHDWLCDPNGFSYVASNNFGIYDMGDRVPLLPDTQLFARFPVQAHLKLIHNGQIVSESDAAEIAFTPKEDGPYRIEAWLKVAGEERPWIYSNPLYLYKPEPSDVALPPTTIAGNVKPLHDIEYIEGKPEDANKHKLDLYLPLDKTNFPVMFFVHGGGWRTGDRGAYISVGNRFAKLGIGVVIPSYRLAPANPHPAQIEDVAAAFAWTAKHIAEHGGDPKQIFAAGHSAGGHLVSLLALDPKYLAKYDLTPAESIRGVMSFSGVYDVRQLALFGPDERSRRSASPIELVNPTAPPFLVAYCQWDYPGVPSQARAFDRALRRSFVHSTLQFIPGENHISEVIHLWKDDDPTAREMLKFIGERSR